MNLVVWASVKSLGQSGITVTGSASLALNMLNILYAPQPQVWVFLGFMCNIPLVWLSKGLEEYLGPRYFSFFSLCSLGYLCFLVSAICLLFGLFALSALLNLCSLCTPCSLCSMCCLVSLVSLFFLVSACFGLCYLWSLLSLVSGIFGLSAIVSALFGSLLNMHVF